MAYCAADADRIIADAKYAAFSALLFLTLHTLNRITQGLPSCIALRNLVASSNINTIQ